MHGFNNDCEFFFSTSSIQSKFGGLTTALFRRAHVFSERFNKKINILTFKYKPDLDEIKKSLGEKGYTNNKVIFNNMYDFLSQYSASVVETNTEVDIKLVGESVIRNPELYEGTITSKKQNGIEEYIKDGVIEQINEFDNKGNTTRIRTFDKGELFRENFFRKDGSMYMAKNFSGKKDRKVTEILLFNKNEEVMEKFSNHKKLQLFWLELLTNNNKNNYIINDNRDMDNLILSHDKRNVIRVFVIHSTHLRAPYDTFSPLRSGNEYLFNHIGLADGIVLLTNKQKEDIILRYGECPIYHVVPHYIEYSEKQEKEKKIRNRFIVVSRFHEEKQIDHIIHAFNVINQKNIDFQLDIYGTGKERDSLNAIINKFSLQEKVILHDFIDKPEAEFSKSVGSFLTSKYEGFGLTILESLKSSCPVFAYDIKYGPNDMLKSGYNGYLIEPNNINALANSVEDFINLPSKEKENVFNNASKSIAEFSKEMFEERWLEVLENAFYYSKYRHEITEKEIVRNKVKDTFSKSID